MIRILSTLIVALVAVGACAQTDFLGGTNVDRSTLLVKHRQGTPDADVDALHKGGQAKRFKHLRWTAVKVPLGQEKRFYQNYLKNKSVERVEFNGLARIDALPNDPLYPKLWGMVKIDAPGAWNQTTSNNVIVAILDTGIDYNHPDLKDNLWTGPNGEHGYSIFAGSITEDGLDNNNHGTHVAGTIAGVGNNGIGVAGLNWRGTKVLSLKFLNSAGIGTYSDAIVAIEKMVDLKLMGVNIRVSNNSWGGGESAALEDAFRLAEGAGILNVCAAGNSGLDTDFNFFAPASIPLEGIVSVLASDQNDNRAWFSNFGLTSTDLLAPGVAIWSTILNGGYEEFNGTSMAAPHVAGVCAMMFGVNPNLTFRQCKSVLLHPDSLDQTTFTQNSTAGGRLNASKAVTNAKRPVPPDNHNPVLHIDGTNVLTVAQATAASMSATGTDSDGDSLTYQAMVNGRQNDGWLIGSMIGANLYPRQSTGNRISVTNVATGRDYGLDARFNVIDRHGGLDSAFGTFFLARDESKVRTLPTPQVSIRFPQGSNPMLSVTMPGVSSNEAKFAWHFSSPSQGVGKTCCFPVNTETPLYNLTYPEPHIYHVQVFDTNGNFTQKRFYYDPGNTGKYVPEAKVKLNVVRGPAPLHITADMSESDPGGARRLQYDVRYWISSGSLSLDGYNPVRSFTLTNPGLHAIQFSVYDATNNMQDMHVELFTVLPGGPVGPRMTITVDWTPGLATDVLEATADFKAWAPVRTGLPPFAVPVSTQKVFRVRQ